MFNKLIKSVAFLARVASGKGDNRDPANEQGAPRFSVTDRKLRQLNSENATILARQMESLGNTLRALAVETRTTAAVVNMIADGLVTVGRDMWTAYTHVSDSLMSGMPTMMSELISLSGGIGTFSETAAAIAKSIGTTSWALSKE